ncbi:MAG: ORF6N domain-containing protein [Verrucomicrobiota bacterium]
MSETKSSVQQEEIVQAIRFIRGRRVMLDHDMASIYGVSTRRLKEQVRRNISRFPPDFMFVLTAQEVRNLRSQIATSSVGHGGRGYRDNCNL